MDASAPTISLQAEFFGSAAMHLLESPLSTDQQVESIEGGGIWLSATVTYDRRFLWWLRGFGADVKVLDILPVEAGSFYIMDRGYVDFDRLYRLHQAGAFFVTRAKRGMNARRVYSSAVDKATGIMCDQTIAMNGFYIAKDYPLHLRIVRRIRFKNSL